MNARPNNPPPTAGSSAMAKPNDASSDSPSFAIMLSAHGAERLVQSSIADAGWRLAFSRPGLVTAKHDRGDVGLPEGTFIRSSMHSIGSFRGDVIGELADQVAVSVAASDLPMPMKHLHVFSRDRAAIGRFGFEPGVDEVATLVAETLRRRLPQDVVACEVPNQIAEPWSTVLDVILVQPNQWLVGHHRVTNVHGSWPGGVQPIEPEHPPISRAYYKAAEAIGWSGFELAPDDLAVEIGSAPGGACGRLLEMGLRVIGVDPAEMDVRIARHRRFEHIRARGGDIPRRRYAGAKWLLVDSNVRPDQTLTTVQNVVTHPSCQFEGLLLTLKIGGYEHADRIKGWTEKIQSWNPSQVAVKQLARNKVEVCFAVRMR